MNFKRMWAMFTARNHEFFRDRAAFGWNFIFPFLIIVGFGLIFGAKEHNQFKIGLFPGESLETGAENTVPPAFQQGRYLQFINFPSQAEGEQKLQHHKIDLLLDSHSPEHRYWINDSSPNGYIAEQLFLAFDIKAGLLAQHLVEKRRAGSYAYSRGTGAGIHTVQLYLIHKVIVGH